MQNCYAVQLFLTENEFFTHNVPKLHNMPPFCKVAMAYG